MIKQHGRPSARLVGGVKPLVDPRSSSGTLRPLDDDDQIIIISEQVKIRDFKEKSNYSPHDELLNLSSDGGGEIFHKLNIARDLEVRKLSLAELSQLSLFD